MSEPVRLLEMDGDPMGASLLRAGLDDGPPPGAKDDVYRSIQAALGVAVVGAAVASATNASAATATTAGATTAGATTATAAGTTTATAAGATTVVKMGAVQALVVKLGIAKTIGIVGLCSATVVGAGFGVREIVRDRTPAEDAPTTTAATTDVRVAEGPRGVNPNRGTPPSAPNDEPASPTPSAAVSEAPIDAATDKPTASAKPNVSTPAVSAAPPPSASAVAVANPAKPEIASEPAGVAEVRSKLRAGDASGALALLSAIQQQFGAGRMSEDRAVLTIEALAASGNTSAARANADAFLKAHPTSPFASRVRTYATP